MSYIKVQCEGCQKLHQVGANELDFEQVGSEERKMGAEIAYEASIEIECECGKDIEIVHRYWEYPEGLENHKETEVSGASVVEDKL